MSKRTSVAEPVSKPKKKELEQLVVDFLTVNKEKQFNINLEDEIIDACMIAENGSIRHKPTLALLGE